MPTLAAEDADKLRAFEQRLQQEGTAAFAAGAAPWEHWEDVGTLGTYRVWRDTTRHTPPQQAPRKPLTTRLLTGLAQLAVLALLVGTTGVYLSIPTTDQQVAGSGIQPPPIVVAGRAERPPVASAPPMPRTRSGTPAGTGPATVAEAPADGADGLPLPVAVLPLQLERVPDPPADTPADAGDQTLAMTLEELPVTAAGPAAGTVPVPAIASTSAWTGAGTTTAAHGAAAEAPDEPAAAAPSLAPDESAAETSPLQIAMHTTAIDTLPERPARRPAPAQEVRNLSSTWVVNLASYNFESMAERKLASFRDKGVNAELVHVTVKGRPMIRIRTSGYKSYSEASDWVTLLEERLGLEGAWVAKYQPDEQ
jgi:hypothetical protein